MVVTMTCCFLVVERVQVPPFGPGGAGLGYGDHRVRRIAATVTERCPTLGACALYTTYDRTMLYARDAWVRIRPGDFNTRIPCAHGHRINAASTTRADRSPISDDVRFIERIEIPAARDSSLYGYQRVFAVAQRRHPDVIFDQPAAPVEVGRRSRRAVARELWPPFYNGHELLIGGI